MSSSGLPLRKSVRQPARQPVRREAAARRRQLFLEPLEQRQLLTVIENFPPVGVDDSYAVIENQALSITATGLPTPGVLYNDSDPNGDALTAIHYSGPGNGTLVFNGDGSFTYTPNADYVGSDSFTYQAYDGALASGLVSVSLTIAEAANQAPVGVADDYTLDENGSLSVSASGVLGNDTDADNDALTASLISGPSNGTLSLSADGSFTYTPAANFDGTDSFTYKANDGEDDSGETTVTLTVVPTNHAPVAVAEGYSVDENTTLTVPTAYGVLANDSDADNDPLTAVLVSPSYGTVALNADGSFTYTPVNGYTGYDSFVYKAHDGTADSAETTVSITVNDVSTPPVANPDAYSTSEDIPLWVDAVTGVLANDQRESQEPVVVTYPAHGSLSMNTIDGSFSYYPYGNYFGYDSFIYKLADGVEATVSLTVNGVNDLPSVSDTSFWGYEDMPMVESSGVLLNNAFDFDGMSGLQVELVGQATNGHVEISSYGSFVYTPNLNYWGPDSFTYRVFDGYEYSNLATASLTIWSVNDPPVASNDTFALPEDEQCFTADVLANDLDIDGDALNVVLMSSGVPGQLWMLSGGYFQYIPPPNFVGQIQFFYQVTDFLGGMSSATVTLNISEVNDAPTANNDAYSIDEDNVLQVPGYLSVLANDEDIDFGGNPTSAQLVQSPTNGTLNFGADGAITYTPNANFNGTDQFTYQAVDTNGATSNFATVTITVYPVNDFPSVTDETYMLLEDEPQSGNVLANDTDLESNPLSATALDPPAHGSLTLDYSGNFTYTPAANYHGPDSFTYLVSDGWSQVMGTVVLTVTPVNDAPEAIDHSYTTDEDTLLVVNDGEGLKAGAIDADNDVLTFAIVDQPGNGTLSVDSETGAFVYTPNPNFYGTDGFAYAVSDGQALDLATVTLTVSPVNDAPVTNDDAYSIVEDVIYNSTESVLDNDSDLDGDALTAVLVDGPQHGSISLYSNGNFSYESDLSIDGLDFFTYQAFDGTAYSTITTVVLTSVTNGPSNSPPQAENDAFALLEDSSIDFFEVELLANDYDSDLGDVVEFASFIGEPLHGSIVSLGSGVWRYTPSNGYHGSDEIRYLVTDGNYQSTGVVYFTVHRKDVDGGNLFTTVPKLTSFTLWNIPEDREEVPGIGIRRNKDVEAVGTLDDDLLYSGVQFNQSLKLYQTYYTVILRRTSDAIQAWSNQSMITPLYAAGVRDFIFPPQAEHLLNYTFYTEWTSGDANMTRADFDLVFRKPNGDEFISDTLVFHPFKSLVVGFVGEAQSPTDPQVGMHMLINEARYHGFDAMLFDEDDISYDSVFGYLRGQADDIIRPSDYDRANANGGGGTPPRNSIKAIKNAVDNMGVSEIALIGYSHGGGAVLELSSELQLAADKPVGRYTISYAAYIDAVKKQSFVGEDRYPVGANVLVNLYQTGPLAPLRVIQGKSVADIPEGAALVEDNVDSAADGGFVYAGVFNQRQHTNRKGRGIAETDEIRNAILFGQWGTYISPFSLTSKVTKF